MHGRQHGRTYQRLAATLAAVVICGAPAWANAQGNVAPLPPVDPGYHPGLDSIRAVRRVPEPSTSAYPVVNRNINAEPSLADRVAELEGELKIIKDKEAAAQEQAAGRPSVKVGGRIMWDWAQFSQGPASIATVGDYQSGTEIRRARIFVSGDAFDVIDYKIQFEFAAPDENDPAGRGNSAEFKDVYITIKELPFARNVRVGHFKEPFSLEEVTSANYMTFMERGLANAFPPSRNIGVMAFGHTELENATFAIGAFTSEADDQPPLRQDDDSGTAVTLRATYLPWYDEATEGRGLFHVGAGYSFRDLDDGTIRFRQRPESHLADYPVNTDQIPASDYELFAAEAAVVYGPFSAQTEYIGAFVNGLGAQPDVDFHGCYFFVSYFLTGEHRPYKRSGGYFDRVRPFENFFRVRDEDGYVRTGKGAWELAYRYSWLDLTDGNVLGGRLSDHTLGLNWYLNPYTRLMFNYVHADADASEHEVLNGVAALTDADFDVFQMRCQIDF